MALVDFCEASNHPNGRPPGLSILAGKIFETARFFWEVWEEGGQGDTRAIALLNPAKVSSSALRDLVLGRFYRQEGLSLGQAAHALARWLGQHEAGQDRGADLMAEMDSLCANANRPFQPVTGDEAIIARSFVRLVRYLELTRRWGLGAHSRCFEAFLASAHVPVGHGHDGGNYPEHVVPCAYLRNRCLALLEDGYLIEDVARAIRPFLAIVMITDEQRKRLDFSPAAGGLGLKDVMPQGWTFETGNIYARLHAANIAFEPPANPGKTSPPARK